MRVRQTDTRGTGSRVSGVLGGVGPRSAPTRPRVLHLQHGVGARMRLNNRGLSIFNVLYHPAEPSGMMEFTCVVHWAHTTTALEMWLVGPKN